jgi:flavorubredoxin
MVARKIKDNIYAVGAIDWDRRLFDELIPLPEGTSYNSYLVRGSEKTALIDTIDPSKAAELKNNLGQLNIRNIDFIVSNHAEQDHSGSIPAVLEWFPQAKVVTNARCKGYLQDLLGVEDQKFLVVEDKGKISLGDKTLEFRLTPWVHWPETMVTFLSEDRILFSCDFFGAHVAKSCLFVDDERETYLAAKRYYAEIMMPFRSSIKNNIKIVEELAPAIIAPSHGLVYGSPQMILDSYKEWVGEGTKNEVVIPYVSMHGSTQKMVDRLVGALIEREIEVLPFNLSRTDIGELAMALVDARTLVIGTPTVFAGPHPQTAYAVSLANALKPKTKFVSVIGSFGWGTKVVEAVTAMMPNLKAEVLDPVIIKGDPKESDYLLIDKLADAIRDKHRAV